VGVEAFTGAASQGSTDLVVRSLVNPLLSFNAFFSETDFVEVSSNVRKEGAKVMAERTTVRRDGRFLGEKSEDVVIQAGGGGKLGEGVAGKRTQEAIDMAKFCKDEFNSGVSNFLGLRRRGRGSEGGFGR